MVYMPVSQTTTVAKVIFADCFDTAGRWFEPGLVAPTPAHAAETVVVQRGASSSLLHLRPLAAGSNPASSRPLELTQRGQWWYNAARVRVPSSPAVKRWLEHQHCTGFLDPRL